MRRVRNRIEGRMHAFGRPELFAASLWLFFECRELFSEKTIFLLREIDAKGSLAKAADSVTVSYVTAWETVRRLNGAFGCPLVIMKTGGAHGGGSYLSVHGKKILSIVTSLEMWYEKLFPPVPATAGKRSGIIYNMKWND